MHTMQAALQFLWVLILGPACASAGLHAWGDSMTPSTCVCVCLNEWVKGYEIVSKGQDLLGVVAVG
jgi:hypothetical protein